MANGYIAALVGRREIMKKLEDAFISGTFQVNYSIQACLTTIKIIERENTKKN